MPIDPTLESAIRARLDDALFHKLLGVEIVRLDDGESEIALRVAPHHLNPGGIVHGGVIASLLDMAGGLAHRTKLGRDGRHVTTHLNVEYLAASSGEGELRAIGRVLKTGRRTAVSEAELRDSAGRLVAKATVGLFIVPPEEHRPAR